MRESAKIFIGAIAMLAAAAGNASAAVYTCKDTDKCFDTCPAGWTMIPNGNGAGCNSCTNCKEPMQVRNGICGFFPTDDPSTGQKGNPLTITDSVGTLVISTPMTLGQ